MANLILENLEYFLGFLRKQLDFSAATMLLFFCPYLWKGDESHQSESSRRFGKLEPAGRSSSSSKLIKNFRHFSKTPKLWLCSHLIWRLIKLANQKNSHFGRSPSSSGIFLWLSFNHHTPGFIWLSFNCYVEKYTWNSSSPPSIRFERKLSNIWRFPWTEWKDSWFFQKFRF